MFLKSDVPQTTKTGIALVNGILIQNLGRDFEMRLTICSLDVKFKLVT